MEKISMTDVLQLSVSERIQLVEDIWDSVAEMPHALVLTQLQREELDRRLEDFRQSPSEGISWESLKSSLAAGK